MTRPPLLPNNRLTVIIRDDAPMIHCGDSPSYRSVSLTLTQEQVEALSLRYSHTQKGTNFHESISKCFIEPY